MLTYDVKFWDIRTRKGRAKPHMVRWVVGGREHSKSFRLWEQADGRRSELLAALRKREQFDTETGLPAGELLARNTPTWFEHAKAYVLMKWPDTSAKHRASIAEALAIVTPVLVDTTRGTPDPKVMRQALYAWTFRLCKNDEGKWVSRLEVERPPADVVAALSWLSKRSLVITEAAKPDHLRAALRALALKLNGERAAENTEKRKRMVLSSVLGYAVEREIFMVHPMKRISWSPPPTDDEIDFRYVPDPRLTRSLIQAVKDQGPRGEHLETFFGCLYYAATRPGEAVAVKESDFILPPEDDEKAWGELLLEESRPEVGSGWTDDGKSYEKRGLKRRARRATRSVPIPPVFVRMVRTHIRTYGVAPDGRIFRAARGGRVRSTEYCELWQTAREKVLTPEELKTPLAEVPYALRHAGISLWLKARVEPAEVARRAGHSIAVLYRFYAKIIRGIQQKANELIDQALNDAS